MRKTVSFLTAVLIIFTVASCSANISDTVAISSLSGSPSDSSTEHTSSAIVEGESSKAPESWVTDEISEDNSFTIQLSFAGDTLLASFKDETTYKSFNEYAANNPPSYFLEKVSHIFKADDFSIVNLENVFTDQDLDIIEKDYDPAYWYKSKTSNVDILTSSGIEGVSLANNHTEDYGIDGYNDTVDTLNTAGILYGDTRQIMYLEKNGFTIAVICTGLWNEYQTKYVAARLDIAKEKSDFQIVFFHGGTELIHEPEEWKINACRELVDCGADLVIGSHPHILQPMESYNGADILYSMGNFCFGDWFRPENRTIIYQTTLTVDTDTLALVDKSSNIIPCYVYTGDRNNYQPTIIESKQEIDKVLDFMNWKCDSPL